MIRAGAAPTPYLLALTLTLATGCGVERRSSSGGGDSGGGSGGGVAEGEGEGAAEGEGEGGRLVEGEGEGDGPAPAAPDLSACGVTDLGAVAPVSAEATTVGGEDRWSSRCNDNRTRTSGPDAGWTWTAPEAGRYRFSTEGSDFDTVLALREPGCDGAVLQCNDDVKRGEIRHSRIVLDMARHQAVLLALDGWGGGDAGAAQLTIERVEVACDDGHDDDGDGTTDCDDSDCATTPLCRGVECPAETIGAFPFSGSGATGGGGSMLGDASCADGAGLAPESAFGFTAPHAGTYLIETTGSSFDTVLYVRDGGCSGRELACDDDGGGSRGTSAVRVALAAGQLVILVVDGYGDASGEFRLAVEGIEAQCGDGVDEDGDGLTDCDDPDCLSADCALGGAWPEHWGTNELEMLEEVNARRAQGGRCAEDSFGPAPALELDEYLTVSARLHSLDMGRQDYFEHQALDGRQPDDRMRDAGFQGAYPTGENIAAGNRTAAEAVEAFMNSPGHCRNILNPQYRVVGFGYAYEAGSTYGHYWTQNFGGSH